MRWDDAMMQKKDMPKKVDGSLLYAEGNALLAASGGSVEGCGYSAPKASKFSSGSSNPVHAAAVLWFGLLCRLVKRNHVTNVKLAERNR